MKRSEEFSSVMFKNDALAPNPVPTIARQSNASLGVFIVREVSTAVCTHPVSVTHTLQLITANLKSMINTEKTSTLIQWHEK